VLLGQSQWSTNEYDLNDVMDPVTGQYMLAKDVVISDGVTYGSAGMRSLQDPSGNFALIIGNYDRKGFYPPTNSNDPYKNGNALDEARQAMDADVPLLFGSLTNAAPIKAGSYPDAVGYTTELKIADLANGNLPNFAGFWVMGNDNNHPDAIVNPKSTHNGTAWENPAIKPANSVPQVGIVNPAWLVNIGPTINEGIIEVGHDLSE